MFKKLSIGKEEFLTLRDAAKELGISIASTPYSFEEVDFLVDEVKVPFIKVASMDIVTLPFLEHIATKNVPVVLSTGMANLDEIRDAVDVFEKHSSRPICVLHCLTYLTEVDLIKMLQEQFRGILLDL